MVGGGGPFLGPFFPLPFPIQDYPALPVSQQHLSHSPANVGAATPDL